MRTKKLNVCIILLVVLNSNIYSQKDTISYNDVFFVKKTNLNERLVFFKDSLFTGYISYEVDGNTRYDEYENGKKIIPKVKRPVLNKVEILKAVNYKKLTLEEKISQYWFDERNESKYFLNKQLFTGYAKKEKILMFFNNGILETTYTMFDNCNIRSLLETKGCSNEKNGFFYEFSEDGEIVINGEYKCGKKAGLWYFYKKNNLDCIIDYDENEIYYYKNDKVFKIEKLKKE